MGGKRRNSSAELKAKATLGAIFGEQTVAERVTKHGVRQAQIDPRKQQAPDGMNGFFSGRVEAQAAGKEGEIETLRARIGRWHGGFFDLRRANEGAIGSSPPAPGR
ncbi:hypothetical protein [Salipiger mangrovisoli]|uniref:Transposase n=1 Tax=Salipiger mangrovisoli TaxID=2865933 RepID=A0ABR9X936_9RHOB|nr:hypothetical protein [Salipiger mangrovisoli]MBE9640023.1 hypothetical protein [Salipiger mangrovisoli]